MTHHDTCEACGAPTEHGKPLCVEHVEGMPYVAALLAAMAPQRARTPRGGALRVTVTCPCGATFTARASAGRRYCSCSCANTAWPVCA